MITSNTLARTFFIRTELGDGGAGFTLDIEDDQFLITAKHVLARGVCTREIEVSYLTGWLRIPVEPIPIGSDTFGALALKLPFKLSRDPTLIPSTALTLAQEMFFLGFPFLHSMDHGLSINGYPIPLARRATLSAFGGSDRFPLLHLDVINSVGLSNCRGFFGGPIISLRNGWRRPSVIGVISDFDEPKKPVVPEAKERQFRARENMNVIIGCGIEPVLEAIAGSTSGMQQELLVS